LGNFDEEPISHAVTRTTPAIGNDIIVVDDNEDAANSLSQLLALAGRRARGGTLAGPAILDIAMPRTNSYETARRLRLVPGGHNLTFIALIGFGQAADQKGSEAAGFQVHVVKPVNPEALLEQVAALCKSPRRLG